MEDNKEENVVQINPLDNENREDIIIEGEEEDKSKEGKVILCIIIQ